MRIVLILSIVFCLLSCRQKKQKESIQIPPRQISVDTADGKEYIAILPSKNLKNAVKLTSEELIIIDSLIQESVKDYNNKVEIRFKELKLTDPKRFSDLADRTIDLKQYKRQYSISLNKSGQKEVSINCLCSVMDNEDWKTEEILVRDGGKCYFNLKINLSEKIYSKFQVNGIA